MDFIGTLNSLKSKTIKDVNFYCHEGICEELILELDDGSKVSVEGNSYDNLGGLNLKSV